MVVAHAAGADAAEGQLRHGHVHQGHVDADAPRARAGQPQVLLVQVVGEQVQRQRVRPGVDTADRVVHVGHRDDRQHWSEDLLGHGRVLVGDVGEHRGGEVAPRDVHLATNRRTVHQAGQPLGVLGGDDAAVVRAGTRVVPEHLPDRALQLRHQLGLGAGGAQHVVGGHAGLPGVDELRPHDAAGRRPQVGLGAHPGGGLAAELQGHRRQVLGRGPHHDPPHALAPGVEDVVPGQLEQGGALGHAAIHHLHDLRVQVARHQPGQGLGGGRGELAGLEHDRVAPGQGAHQRHQHEVHGVVPRPDDEH